jgi:hypothetical protein
MNVLSGFFMRVITDDTITPECANELFNIVIKQALGRKQNSLNNRLLAICHRHNEGRKFTTNLSREKFNLLTARLTRPHISILLPS